MSDMYKLKMADFAKGAIVAILIAFVGGIQQMLSTNGLDFAAWDWAFIVNLAISGFVAYLAKNFVTDENGRVFGKLG